MTNSNFLPTEVARTGLTALIQNLGRDCQPTQFLREFTKNAIEACQRTRLEDRRVIVDFNRQIFESSGVHKICFIDTGDGMSETQMLNLLNNLSASGDVRDQHQNYGVGAKISALTRNHCGILYESWKGGVGCAVYIKYNAQEAIYGIQGIPTDDGQVVYAVPLPPEQRPDEITDHGTRVTLFGMEDGQDTMLPPEGVPGIRESWIALYLNTRFFRLPEHVQLSARIGYYRDANPRHNYLLNISGQKASLDGKAILQGDTRLRDAKLYWWVMPKGADGHGREMLKGHTALVNQDEIFDISDARSSRIAYFGVIVGRDRVIIYVEPDNAVQNTARTGLVCPDGSPISWDSWQDEFRSAMPPELKAFLDQLQSESETESHTEGIRERLRGIRELYKLSRYRAAATGTIQADPESGAQFNTGNERTGPTRNRVTEQGQIGGRPGSLATNLLTALAASGQGVAAVAVEPDPFPRVQWVKASEGQEALTDRAAEFIQTQNLILANSEYQGLADLVRFLGKDFRDVPEVARVIEEEVRAAYEQALTECVAGALSLKNRQYWNPSDFNTALSREALTVAVMQKYWMITAIKRVLATKIRAYYTGGDAAGS